MRRRTPASTLFPYTTLFRSTVSFVEFLNRSKVPLHDKPVYFKAEKDGVALEIAMQWNDGYDERIYTFANNINTHEGGSHLRSEEHTSELQSRRDLVCRLLLE